MESPKLSWKGFKLSKNMKDTLKQCVYILVPAVLVELQTNSVLSASAAGLIGKAIFSAIEYYWKKR